MVTDQQVRKLQKLLSQGMTLQAAAIKSSMSEPTARRYRRMSKLPSEVEPDHHWRTRKDPMEEVWPKIQEMLEENPGLQATTLLAWLKRESPDKYDDSHLRTLQRRLKQWRATEGPAKEIFFSQTHYPGDLCASDFTHMTSLNVTIAGQRFDHMVFHFVLTYSNWESVTVCHSESFESLSEGLQHALWNLKGVPKRHRTDRLSAAVNNLSEEKEFTQRYQALMDHYELAKEKIRPREAHENGDIESSHRHFKTAVAQQLMMRGSHDFENLALYKLFLQEVVDGRNAGRKKRFQEELPELQPLPKDRMACFRRESVRVNTGSLIHVQNNTYSVDSRLKGERVEVRLYANYVEIWYAQRRVDRFTRLRGQGKQLINYRHIIDTLVRKPGAFENYRYREELFPTSRFRMAYDQLRETLGPRASVKEYLKILHDAAHESETAVDEAPRALQAKEQPVTAEAVRQFIQKGVLAMPVTDVHVCQPDLTSFDKLFSDVSVFLNKEVSNECHGCESDTRQLFTSVAAAIVS
jgi:hypothetical protein